MLYGLVLSPTKTICPYKITPASEGGITNIRACTSVCFAFVIRGVKRSVERHSSNGTTGIQQIVTREKGPDIAARKVMTLKRNTICQIVLCKQIWGRSQGLGTTRMVIPSRDSNKSRHRLHRDATIASRLKGSRILSSFGRLSFRHVLWDQVVGVTISCIKCLF